MSICESVGLYLYAGPGDVPAAAAVADLSVPVSVFRLVLGWLFPPFSGTTR